VRLFGFFPTLGQATLSQRRERMATAQEGFFAQNRLRMTVFRLFRQPVQPDIPTAKKKGFFSS